MNFLLLSLTISSVWVSSICNVAKSFLATNNNGTLQIYAGGLKQNDDAWTNAYFGKQFADKEIQQRKRRQPPPPRPSWYRWRPPPMPDVHPPLLMPMQQQIAYRPIENNNNNFESADWDDDVPVNLPPLDHRYFELPESVRHMRPPPYSEVSNLPPGAPTPNQLAQLDFQEAGPLPSYSHVIDGLPDHPPSYAEAIAQGAGAGIIGVGQQERGRGRPPAPPQSPGIRAPDIPPVRDIPIARENGPGPVQNIPIRREPAAAPSAIIGGGISPIEGPNAGATGRIRNVPIVVEQPQQPRPFGGVGESSSPPMTRRPSSPPLDAPRDRSMLGGRAPLWRGNNSPAPPPSLPQHRSPSPSPLPPSSPILPSGNIGSSPAAAAGGGERGGIFGSSSGPIPRAELPPASSNNGRNGGFFGRFGIGNRGSGRMSPPPPSPPSNGRSLSPFGRRNSGRGGGITSMFSSSSSSGGIGGRTRTREMEIRWIRRN